MCSSKTFRMLQCLEFFIFPVTFNVEIWNVRQMGTETVGDMGIEVQRWTDRQRERERERERE